MIGRSPSLAKMPLGLMFDTTINSGCGTEDWVYIYIFWVLLLSYHGIYSMASVHKTYNIQIARNMRNDTPRNEFMPHGRYHTYIMSKYMTVSDIRR